MRLVLATEVQVRIQLHICIVLQALLNYHHVNRSGSVYICLMTVQKIVFFFTCKCQRVTFSKLGDLNIERNLSRSYS